MALRDLLRRPPPGPLADLAAVPTWPVGTPLAEVELLAVDLETTGLDARRHEILSVGWAPVAGAEVRLDGAAHRRVRPHGDVGESAAVHGLTDDALAAAPPVEQVLPELLHTLTGPRRLVLLAHHAGLETAFLAAACRRVHGGTVKLQVIDTVELERRLLGSGEHVRDGALRLDACRARHRLPRYRAHSALTDALACAELFLAQCAALEARARRPLVLADVLRR
ncbi:exonuclease domain-containing protein [Ornithinimicrobium avium]|uniref:DNA polymerase III subunit epsilon n=1 Tax=Ornithinimicrobium avium TaxID=2283195 RepID=A0A345NR14_9MICO|nr:exonuclease domain-containing protein [Ornithinimicrobium avium]AXH97472.1 DNA polymerase III subunit epsilon [Ornithinimicrobium avium]